MRHVFVGPVSRRSARHRRRIRMRPTHHPNGYSHDCGDRTFYAGAVQASRTRMEITPQYRASLSKNSILDFPVTGNFIGHRSGRRFGRIHESQAPALHNLFHFANTILGLRPVGYFLNYVKAFHTLLLSATKSLRGPFTASFPWIHQLQHTTTQQYSSRFTGQVRYLRQLFLYLNHIYLYILYVLNVDLANVLICSDRLASSVFQRFRNGRQPWLPCLC